jgi:hypothetical protein
VAIFFVTPPRASPPDQTNQSRDRQGAVVTTTGKRGKKLASKSYELAFREVPQINSAISGEADASAGSSLHSSVN